MIDLFAKPPRRRAGDGTDRDPVLRRRNRRRNIAISVLVALIVFLGITAINLRANDNAERISENEKLTTQIVQLQQTQQRVLDLILKATDPKATAAALRVFSKLIRDEIARDFAKLSVTVRESSGVRTVVVTRTITVCRLPNGKPC